MNTLIQKRKCNTVRIDAGNSGLGLLNILNLIQSLSCCVIQQQPMQLAKEAIFMEREVIMKLVGEIK